MMLGAHIDSLRACTQAFVKATREARAMASLMRRIRDRGLVVEAGQAVDIAVRRFGHKPTRRARSRVRTLAHRLRSLESRTGMQW